jgi:hypothetical protein
MNVDWLAWSNPVAIWWIALLIVSSANNSLWLFVHRRSSSVRGRQCRVLPIELLMLLLCAAYVFGCAFRAVLPRADVQRICLFDTWLSSVFVGRLVATIAEVCFVVQWAIVLYHVASAAQSNTARRISALIVPLILLAECCSWYSVITTSYLGNTLENSLWAFTFFFIATALLQTLGKFQGIIRVAVGSTIAGIVGYLAFLAIIDVPMYFARWQADLANGKHLLGIIAGLHDVSARWIVTRDFAVWKEEIAWMSLYFSVAVWSSLALCGFFLARDRLLQRGRLSLIPTPIR